MDNIKLNGYFIDIGVSDYNTWGRIDGEWKDGVSFYIDINRNVYLSSDILHGVEDYTPGKNENYKPIGERVGELEKKFNSVVFSNFSMGKGLYKKESGEMVISESDGITLYGSLSISLDPDNEKDDFYKRQSVIFFENMKDIKNKLNREKSILIAEINNSRCRDEYFGIDHHFLQEDPVKYLHTYCNNSNEDYQMFKKYIVQMHSMFNSLLWNFEERLMSYSSFLLLVAKAYKDINDARALNNQVKLNYIVSLPCDLSGVCPIIISSWFGKCHELFKEEQYEKPSSINFMVMQVDSELFDTSVVNNRIFDDMVLCPFSTLQMYEKHSSLDLCKSILNTDSLDLIKGKSIISLWINNEEPNNSYENPNSKFVDESFVEQVSQKSLTNNLQGILLYRDRGEYNGPSTKKPPVSISFDDSISNFYSQENQTKLGQYLSNKP